MVLQADDVHLSRDRDLVLRFQAGDQEAFEDLYRRYRRRLERFCAQRVGDSHEAEDLAQEAFVRAYRAMPDLAGERRFYPWMTVIAARLCVDTHRRRARSQPAADIDLGPVDGGQDAVVAAVDVALLNDALGQLSPRHRDVLNLRERQEWSYQRIADHYSVSLGTVEALILRARRALRREFMALAGPDHTRAGVLGGTALLGWTAHRLAGARHWLGALPGGGLGQLAAGGAATVAIGGAAALGVGVGSPGPGPAPTVGAVPATAPAARSRAVIAPASTVTPVPAGPVVTRATVAVSPRSDARPTTTSTAAVPSPPPPTSVPALLSPGGVGIAESPMEVVVPGVGRVRIDPRPVTRRVGDALRRRGG